MNKCMKTFIKFDSNIFDKKGATQQFICDTLYIFTLREVLNFEDEDLSL